jgi:hypothetical protein
VYRSNDGNVSFDVTNSIVSAIDYTYEIFGSVY